MPFGKHKGIRMIDVPADYLLWLHDQEWAKKGQVHEYIINNMDSLKKEVEDSKNN